MMAQMRSRRVMLAFAAIVIIAIGLTTRLPGSAWPPIFAKYLGSLLWGVMVYCIVAWLRPNWRTARLMLVASCVAVAVEVSQLWHPFWLDAIRATRIGVLLLGRFFAWADIVAYLAGTSIAAVADRFVTYSGKERREFD